MHQLTCMAVASVLSVLAQCVARAQVSAPATTSVSVGTLTRIAEIKREMESLDGSTAQKYFDLGEELAEIHATYADARLAQAMLVHAFELDRVSGRRDASGEQKPGLAASACVLLTKVSSARDQEWLLSVAAAVDSRYAGLAQGADMSGVSETLALQVATVLGAVRAGDGVTARNLLAKPEVKATLTRYERLLTGGAPGGAARIIDAADKWPCSHCNNERYIVKARTPSAAGEAKVCAVCRGRPGLALSEFELVNQLRLESRLLSGIQSSWSAIVTADGDSPLRDPDPRALARAMGVDVTRPLFRDGVWMNREEMNSGKSGAEIQQARQPKKQPSLIAPNYSQPRRDSEVPDQPK